MNAKHKELAREIRRKSVTENLLAGFSYREMAEALGVSKSTIANDVKVVLGRLQNEQEDKINDWVTLENARLDILTKCLWKKAVSGDIQTVDRVLKIMERRAKMLGLDVTSNPSVNINNNNFLSWSADDFAEGAKYLEEWRKAKADESTGSKNGDSQMSNSI